MAEAAAELDREDMIEEDEVMPLELRQAGNEGGGTK